MKDLINLLFKLAVDPRLTDKERAMLQKLGDFLKHGEWE